ncbi:hypothetical protein EPO15_16710 [bacterium]|nr:MAG: hypothetical protein EPO15_16710 [bacterium]
MIDAVRWTEWAAFAALCGAFTWTDFRVKKIRNRALLAGLAAALAGYAALGFWTWRAEGRFYVSDYYADAARHVGTAWAAGLGLWLLRLWPAGDAKLFMVLGAFFPLIVPDSPLLPWRATLTALMNVFIPAAVGIVAAAFVWVWRTRAGRRLEAARAAGTSLLDVLGRPRWGQLWAEAKAGADAARAYAQEHPFKVLVGFADWCGFFASASVLLAVLTLRYGQTEWTGLAMCAFSFLVWSSLGALLGGGRVLVAWAAVAAALRLMPGLDPADVGARTLHLAVYGGSVGAGVQVLKTWLKGGGGLWWLWGLVPLLLGFVSPFLHVTPSLLALGALLGAGIMAVGVHVREDVLNWKTDALEPHLLLSAHSVQVVARDAEFFEDELGTLYPDGLTHEQVQLLKGWCAENNVPELTMQRTLSFAAWICAGYLLTAFLHGDVLNRLLRAAL